MITNSLRGLLKSDMWIGIDPSAINNKSGGGAVAIIQEDNGVVKATCVIQLNQPEEEIISVVKKIARFLVKFKINCYLCIEQVSSMPGQGVASTFKFGKGFGWLVGVFSSLGFIPSFTIPRVWQKIFNISPMEKKDRKARLKEEASKYWTKPTLITADAICIAIFLHFSKKQEPIMGTKAGAKTRKAVAGAATGRISGLKGAFPAAKAGGRTVAPKPKKKAGAGKAGKKR